MRMLIGFTFLFITLNVFSQRKLEYKDITKENDVYGGEKDQDACITFSASNKIALLFNANTKQIRPSKIDTLGTDIKYHLVFDASDGREDRTINIYASGYSPITIQRFLHPKQQVNIIIFDPDSILDNCFNQLTREGEKLFQAGNYEDAKRKYNEIFNNCHDVKDEEKKYVDNKLQEIDSFIKWKIFADDYYASSDYLRAIIYYQKIVDKNSTDESSRNKFYEVQKKQTEDCIINFNKAESYFHDKNFGNAKLMYEKVRDQSCDNKAYAIKRISEIEHIRPYIHAFTYEVSKDVPIGISTGNYKEYKASGYFTLRLNSASFEALQTNNDSTSLLTKRPEINISFGWTIPIVKPVWIFFGPGYTGVGEYVNKNDKVSPTDKVNTSQNDNLTLKLNSAISPEIGLLGKITFEQKVGIVLRYTFQYRFALDKEAVDYIGKIRSVFGIGVCF